MTSILPSIDPTAQSAATAAKQPVSKAKMAADSMAADFEAIFVRQMLSTMRTASLGEGLFDGQGMEQFRDMQDSMLAENIAEKGVFGIANLLTSHVENKS